MLRAPFAMPLAAPSLCLFLPSLPARLQQRAHTLKMRYRRYYDGRLDPRRMDVILDPSNVDRARRVGWASLVLMQILDYAFTDSPPRFTHLDRYGFEAPVLAVLFSVLYGNMHGLRMDCQWLHETFRASSQKPGQVIDANNEQLLKWLGGRSDVLACLDAIEVFFDPLDARYKGPAKLPVGRQPPFLRKCQTLRHFVQGLKGRAISLTLDSCARAELEQAGLALAGTNIDHLVLNSCSIANHTWLVSPVQDPLDVSAEETVDLFRAVRMRALSLCRIWPDHSDKCWSITPPCPQGSVTYHDSKSAPGPRFDITALHLSGDVRAWCTLYVVEGRSGLGLFISAFPHLQELTVKFWGPDAAEQRELLPHLPLTLRELVIGAVTLEDITSLVQRLPHLEVLHVSSLVATFTGDLSVAAPPVDWLMVQQDLDVAAVHEDPDRLAGIFAVMAAFPANLTCFHITLSDCPPQAHYDPARQIALEAHFQAPFADPGNLPFLQDCAITLPYTEPSEYLPDGVPKHQRLAFRIVDGTRSFIPCKISFAPIGGEMCESVAQPFRWRMLKRKSALPHSLVMPWWSQWPVTYLLLLVEVVFLIIVATDVLAGGGR